MDSPQSTGEMMPIFYVGQHETKRLLPVTDQVLRQAQDCNVSISLLILQMRHADRSYSMICLQCLLLPLTSMPVSCHF